MTDSTDLASRLLKVEQQLEAYEKLHAEELAELKRILNECKREIIHLASHPSERIGKSS